MYLPRHRPGPALRRAPLPTLSVTLSAIAHALVLGLVIVVAGVWGPAARVYVVNLVPAIPAVGSPAGQSVARSVPTRPAPAPPQRKAPDAETRQAPTPREARGAPPSPPPSLPELAPAESRVVAGRPTALPRPGEKELPPLAAPARRRTEPAPPPRPSPAPGPSAEPKSAVAPIPLGRPDGSPAGVASLALDVSDFPFTYYLRQIQQKVSEKWTPPAQSTEPVRRAVILFEIARDGKIAASRVEKSSGNVWYDQSALRAVLDATPFPPLPQEFQAESLRVHFGFDFVRDQS